MTSRKMRWRSTSSVDQSGTLEEEPAQPEHGPDHHGDDHGLAGDGHGGQARRRALIRRRIQDLFTR
jgi:hypothetical protein